MLKPVTNITITQTGSWRNKIFFFDFVTSWELNDGWENFTNTGKITFPKNIYVRDENGKRYPLFGENKNTNDIFRRGDKVKIEANYIYWDDNLTEKETNKVTIIEGYISAVKSEMPITIEFEDSFYLMKQEPMTNRVFKKTDSLEDILNSELQKVNSKHGTNFKVNNLTSTTLNFSSGTLTVNNETIAEFLAKLKKDYFLRSYFRGNELRIGSLIYIESESKDYIFKFQNNIISHNLEYKRKDDIVLSAVASNHIEENAGVTKKGVQKTKKRRIEVLVTFKNNRFESKVIKQGDHPDPNTDGERRTFVFLDAKNEAQLIEKARNELEKFYYTGFKGDFLTFGEPYVQFGDNAIIQDDILPERNGTYKIKGVNYSGGKDGYRQNIILHYKINV